MFTGIVEEIGKIVSVVKGQHSSKLWIQGSVILDDLKLGDSVAVNGVCLTVSQLDKKQWMADVMHETLKRSNLGQLKGGSLVNLERAMKADGRFGGHLVAGHIDGTGHIIQIIQDDNAIRFSIEASEKILGYIIEKGSITVDGISLTITAITKNSFEVSIIPHTMKHSILGRKRVGDRVNLENDLVGKYIERLLFNQKSNTNNVDEKSGGLTMDFLTGAGF